MDYARLQYDFQHSVSLKLLRSKNAPLILSFLHAQFKPMQRRSVPWLDLVAHLEVFLEPISADYPKSAAAYLKDWANEEHRVVRVVRREQHDLVELTADTERCFVWLESLYQRAFVGTESRFLSLVDLLEQMVFRSTEDVTVRVKQLEQQKTVIQNEIDLIQAQNSVQTMNDTQIRERFWQATDLARNLLADFAAIEENFRALARTLQERQLQPDTRKGSLLGFVLGADQELQDSPQGRSFYAFWNFLSSEDKRAELRDLLEKIYTLPVLSDLTKEQILLERIVRHLSDAGEKVVHSNQRLADQLRRLLDEQNLLERRRVRELLREIKQLAYLAPDDEFWLMVDSDPEVFLPLEKGLWEAPVVRDLRFKPQKAIQLDLNNPVFAELYQQFWVDEAVLKKQIHQILTQQPECTLLDVFAKYPVQQGLSEVLAYMAIASREKQHRLDSSQTVLVHWQAGENPQTWQVPQVTFRREA
jgi:hypothetical protein